MGIDRLLTKYRAGRRPPLDELIDEGLLKVFQRGLAEEKMTPIGILLPAQNRPEGVPTRWYEGRWLDLGESWERYCSRLREWKTKEGARVFETRCKESDTSRGAIAAEKKKPIIHLCHAGLVDYVIPVVVDGQSVALLLSGQQCPVEGKVWSRNFINEFATQETVAGSEDAWGESVKRQRRIMEEMCELAGQPTPELVALAEKACIISPDQVPGILQDMENASRQLAALAQRTVRYELDTIRAYFTSQVAKLLAVSDEDFWSGFSKVLAEYAQFYGMDYGFFCMLKRENDEYMYAVTGVEENFPDWKPPLIATRTFFPDHGVDNCKPVVYKPHEAKRLLFKSARLFSSPCYVIPMVVNGPLGIMVMGCRQRGKSPSVGPATMELLQKQCEEMSIILENRRQMQARDMYVTDIAHEIRSPLAAVLATAENLVAGGLDQVEHRSSRILKRLRGLQMAVERFMMLDKLLSNPQSLNPRFVCIYDAAKECETVYADLARERGVRITLDRTLSTLPKVRADSEAVKHALGNLVHNAIKYGDPDTDVVVEGRRAGNQTKIDVRNIGIPIPDQAIGLLGQRHFRTVEAIKREPSGTGIGLTMVARFLKVVGGTLEIKSERLPSGRYHTIFSMYLPK